MTTNFPTWPVDGPQPIRPLFGLLQAADATAAGVTLIVDTDERPPDAPGVAGLVPAAAGRERWLAGVAVYPYPSGVPQVWDGCGGSGAPTEKDIGENVPPPEFAAITVYQAIDCTSQQVPDEAAFKARAARALDAKASYAVAREFMGGALFGSQPFLSDGNGEFPNGDAPVKPNYGVQLLEAEIAKSGSLGLIHCSPMLATALLGSGFALSDKTGVIRTINGIPVIPDFGYTLGATPNSHADPDVTQEWAYATGPIDVRKSEIFTTPDTRAEALDRGSGGATNGRPNTFTYFAEQYYVVDWDTAVQAAVLVDRCSVDCNPAS